MRPGPGPPVDVPNPTSEVANTHIGRQTFRGWGQGRGLTTLAPRLIGISNSRSRSIWGLGCQSAISTLPPWSPVSFVGRGDLGGL
ncbi:hypothetical protein CRG98_049622, partial [Punica granatum]